MSHPTFPISHLLFLFLPSRSIVWRHSPSVAPVSRLRRSRVVRTRVVRWRSSSVISPKWSSAQRAASASSLLSGVSSRSARQVSHKSHTSRSLVAHTSHTSFTPVSNAIVRICRTPLSPYVAPHGSHMSHAIVPTHVTRHCFRRVTATVCVCADQLRHPRRGRRGATAAAPRVHGAYPGGDSEEEEAPARLCLSHR